MNVQQQTTEIKTNGQPNVQKLQWPTTRQAYGQTNGHATSSANQTKTEGPNANQRTTNRQDGQRFDLSHCHVIHNMSHTCYIQLPLSLYYRLTRIKGDCHYIHYYV